MRNLYFSIYLTVVAVLLAFALVAGLLVRSHVGGERGRIETVVNQRTVALGELLANSLPDAAAPVDDQASAVQDWARRMRVPLALDARDGQRIVASASFERLQAESPERVDSAVRIPLGDGRILWLARPGPRPDPFGRPLRRPPLPFDDRDDPRGPQSGRSDGARPMLADAAPGLDGSDRPPPDPHRGGDAGRRTAGWMAPGWFDEAGVLLSLLVALFVAVAAGAYPVVRRLTRRLEVLKQGVQTFGDGDFAHRLSVDGNDEVASVAASFNQAAQRIDDLVRANRSLLANASHELRSPLARLKMAVELMDGAEPVRRVALKREIDRDIRELDALVEEVLLASRLDAQVELQREPVDLLGLLAEESARVGAPFDGTPLRCLGDERLLRRALRNLLENARRYGGDEVSARLARQASDGPVEWVVCDRGPGVPEAHRDRVFEPFFRLPGHAEHVGGVGLGLSLVRQIARRHGGDVCCLARPGGGSCFVLTLPADSIVA